MDNELQGKYIKNINFKRLNTNIIDEMHLFLIFFNIYPSNSALN
jgi:hypothetical protein